MLNISEILSTNVLKENRAQIADTFYLFLLQAVNYLIPIILIPYLMLKLGAEKYGYIGFATAIVNYFVLIVEFGFNLSATKRIAIAYEQKEEIKINKIFYATLYAKLILLFFSFLLLFIIGYSIPQFRVFMPTVWCMSPMILGMTFTFSWFFQGIGKVKVISIINSIAKFLVLPLIFILIKNPEDYKLAALLQSLVFVVAAVISIIILLRYKIIHYTEINFASVKDAIKDSWPLFLSTVATSIYTQLFTIILAFFVSPSVIGKYSSAERIMRSCCFIIYIPISQAFYPRVSALTAVDICKANKLFINLRKVIFYIMLLISLSLIISAYPLTYFFGQDYMGMELLLIIMSIVPVAIALGGLTGQMGLIALGNDISKKHFRTVYWFVSIISLPLVLFLTWIFKEIGAAIALVATEYMVFVLMTYYYKKDSLCYCL